MAKGQLRVRIVGDDRDLTKKLKSAGGALTKFAAVGVAAVGAATVFSVKKFADFDQAMTRSLAIMGDVSDEMRGEMSDAARQVAKTTVFSAEEAAEAYFFLASAGMDAGESIEALPKVAAFAQAGNFDMARATDLLTDAQSSLGLVVDDSAQSLENLARVGDVLVKANTLANASVEEFSEALTTKAGAALNQLNKDVEEGVAVLAVYADQGLKGGAAGTQLNAVLEGLTRTARTNAEAYGDLGVSVFDADGEMRNMADIVGDLEGALEGMSTEQQLAELSSLGLTRTARDGVVQLLGNADAIREYEKELRDAGGTVDEIAGKQLETFHAQLGLLKDQLIDVALGIGERLMPHIMAFVEFLQEHGPTIEAFVEKALAFIADVINNVVIPAVSWLRDVIAGFTSGFNSSFAESSSRIEAFGAAVRVAFDFVRDVIEQAREWISGFGESNSETATWLKDTWQQIREIFTSAFEAIVAAVEWVVSVIRWTWENFGDHILGFLTSLWDNVKEVIGGALDVIRGIFEVFAGLFTGDWSRLWDGVKQIFSGLWRAVVAILNQAWNTITSIFKVAGTAISKTWSWLWQNVRQIVSNMLSSIANWIRGRIDAITSFFTALPGRVMSAVRALPSQLMNLFRQALGRSQDAVRDGGMRIIDWVRGLPKRILSALGNLGKLLFSAGKAILGGLVKGIKSVAMAPVNAVKGVVGKVRNLLPFSPAKEGPFAGAGAPEMSGQAIGHDLAAGLSESSDQFARAMLDLLDVPTVNSRGLPDPDDLAPASRSGGGGGSGSSAETNRLLRELLRKMDQGGDVYLDGRKVGRSLVKQVEATQGGWR